MVREKLESFVKTGKINGVRDSGWQREENKFLTNCLSLHGRIFPLGNGLEFLDNEIPKIR